MSNSFIIKPRYKISIRIEEKILDKLDELSAKSGHSHNEIINQSVKYALKDVKLIETEKNDT